MFFAAMATKAVSATPDFAVSSETRLRYEAWARTAEPTTRVALLKAIECATAEAYLPGPCFRTPGDQLGNRS